MAVDIWARGPEKVRLDDHDDYGSIGSAFAIKIMPPGGTPITYNQAVFCPDSLQWIKAIEKEIETLREKGTFVEVNRPLRMNVVNSKWVFKIKDRPFGSKGRYKARLCTKGFTQVEGVDFDTTFTPVLKFTILQVLLCLAGIKHLEVTHVDIKGAFLNGVLEEKV